MRKEWVLTLLGTLGGVCSWLFGGWDGAATVLLVLMAIDYLTGIIGAAVFHVSTKSPTGALESKAGWKGLVRKCLTLLLVTVGAMLDKLLGTAFVRDAVIIAFCANEALSITENAGLMGVPVPGALRRAIDVLNRSAEESGHETD